MPHMSAEEFRWAEEEYSSLLEQLETESMSQKEFDALVNVMMFRDAHGRYWKLGADSGRWYVHNGTRWRQASPYVELGSGAPIRRRSRHGVMSWVLLAGLLLLLMIAGVAAFFLGFIPT